MRRLLREYLALPGLSLTVEQLQRLLALDAGACQELLAAVAQSGCLVHRQDDGRYVRPPDLELAAWRRAVHAALDSSRHDDGVSAVPPPRDGVREARSARLAGRTSGARAARASAYRETDYRLIERLRSLACR